MAKLIAILNVVAWSGFWAFGYLALASGGGEGGNTLVALVLAALGAGVGLICWLWLVRHSEATGYAKPANRVLKPEDIEETH